MKKLIALTLAIITLISAFALPTSAASSQNVAQKVRSKLPIVTYASPVSGANKVYAYSDSSLSTKQTSYYIDSYKDKLVITDIRSDGQAVCVTYPTSNGNTRTKWFRTDDILGINTVDIREYTSDSKYNVYRMASSGALASNGYISKDDSCISLGSHSVNGRNYYVTIYPVSNTTANGIKNIKHKIALNTVTGKNTSSSNTGSSDSWNDNSSIDLNTDRTPLVNALTTVINTGKLVSPTEIQTAAARYGISQGSSAYKALQSIDSKYGDSFTSSEKKGTLIFMFEGVGSSSSSARRMNAMCVVVQNGKITYINRNSSTIPDYPFDPSKNDYTPIYSFTTVNHNNSYAALKVSNAEVLRFKSKSNYYGSTSTGINVHRRSTDSIAANNAGWVNSAGCLLVGASGKSSSSEYAQFIRTLGIVGSGASAASKYTNKVSGKIVVDRSYAYNYLINVGYPSAAVNVIG